jgi:XRE family transcriptional regulator, regulator of sulfur utilization
MAAAIKERTVGKGKERPPSGIGRRIREFRDRLGWSQEKLAQEAGLTTSNISQLERDKITDPRALTLRAIANALGVTLDDLLPGRKVEPED